MRNTRGVGSVYRPKDRKESTGELQETKIWWIRYSHHGVKHRESSGSEVHAHAAALLKQRIGQAGIGKPVTSTIRRTTLNDLTNLVLADYRDNAYDTIERQRDAFNHLFGFFGTGCPAEEITSARLEEYKIWRRQQPDGRAAKRKHDHLYKDKPSRTGCAVATCNRELASLRHAFKLAARQTPPLVTNVPHIALSRERNRRTGFFEREQFEAVRNHLPDYLKAPMTVAYYTGRRTPSEILTRQPKHIVDGMLVLDHYEGKNEQPRKFPLDIIPELRETIEAQLAAMRKIEIETGRVIPWLFPNRYGNRVVDYLPAWRKACKAAGCPGRIPHDFRRTAARNLINAGVDPPTTMQLVGWEDIGMLKRYAIIDDGTLRRAVGKLNLHVNEQKRAVKKVIAIR